MHENFARYYTTISELRKHPSRVFDEANGEIAAIFNHNEIVSYIVSPTVMEELLEMKADVEALRRIEKMDINEAIDVDIDEL